MDTMIMKMPAVALRGMVILPGMVAHFDVSRAKSIKAVEEAMMDEQKIFLVAQKDVEQENPDIEDLFKIGIIAEVKQVIKLQNNIVRILVEGKERAELSAFLENPDYLLAEIIRFDEEVDDGLPEEAKEAMLRSIQETFGKYVVVNPKMGKELQRQLSEITDLEKLMNQLANSLPVHFEEKQKILDAVSMTERYEVLMALLLKEIEIIAIKNDFQAKVKAHVDKNQKEYLLREQMKVIREELGEDNTESDADHFMDALGKIKADKEVKEKIKKEIDRFKNISSSSSESAVARGYIETLLELPWNKTSRDNKDLKNAEQILNADHYGLEKVKERMLEFLAVRNLTSKGESPIICLVGPPGTGKTSIARSVAKALDKKYVRISLGGVRDEAEIRGHRRTYIGAMPGRIMEGMKRSGASNPVMVLDEVDKLAKDYGGDPASALLEVLDPEQNNSFTDHYMNVPYDLSNVLFVCTANSVDTIPEPLLNRMEVIQFPGYTAVEKAQIAKKHLLPRAMQTMGIPAQGLKVSDKAIARIISEYTAEAGVRGLKKQLDALCRYAAVQLVKGEEKSISVSAKRVPEFLGRCMLQHDRILEHPQPGIVTGLAWTQAGGEILFIETVFTKGNGKLTITGQLGDVMKESAAIAVTLVKELYPEKAELFAKNDLHIHVPAGAVPKDGPSAGITLVTALSSLVSGKPVNPEIAMTGEVSLRGGIMPIGGLPEKLMAAQRAGVKKVYIPKDNMPDLEDVAAEVKEKLTIVPVKKITDVLKAEKVMA